MEMNSAPKNQFIVTTRGQCTRSFVATLIFFALITKMTATAHPNTPDDKLEKMNGRLQQYEYVFLQLAKKISSIDEQMSGLVKLAQVMEAANNAMEKKVAKNISSVDDQILDIQTRTHVVEAANKALEEKMTALWNMSVKMEAIYERLHQDENQISLLGKNISNINEQIVDVKNYTRNEILERTFRPCGGRDEPRVVTGCKGLELGRRYLISDQGGVLNSSGYGSAVTTNGMRGDVSAQWTFESLQNECIIKAGVGHYLGRCYECLSRDGEHSLFSHVPTSEAKILPWSLWKVEKIGNKVAFKADIGNYIASCENCLPVGGKGLDFVFVNATTPKGPALWSVECV